MNEITLFNKISSLPDKQKKEVHDFVDYLESKTSKESIARKPGLAKGLIRMREDFDEPLHDFQEYMK